jgi:hypothetical protein
VLDKVVSSGRLPAPGNVTDHERKLSKILNPWNVFTGNSSDELGAINLRVLRKVNWLETFLDAAYNPRALKRFKLQ